MEHLHHRLDAEQREVCRPSFDAEVLRAGFSDGQKRKNRGQLEMYLVENAHEPIVDREIFDRVQEMKGHIKHTV